MTCYRFEIISAFSHIVTPNEEQATSNDRLRKIRTLPTLATTQCYERMVRSKARTHFRQYIRNKPTKWGFKYWVIADVTGYTVDFNLYIRKATESSGNGLGFDVVMELIHQYAFQGYELFTDNFYTSPILLTELLQYRIVSTGTLM